MKVGRWMMGLIFIITHTWTCESALAYLKDSMQPPYSYKGNLKGLLELFLTEHNKRVEKKKQFHIGNVTVKDNNDIFLIAALNIP